ADRILMAKLKGDPLKDLVHLNIGGGIERFSAGDRCKFVEKCLALHTDRARGISAVQDPDAVGHNVRLFHQSSYLIEIVAGRIVLAVADHQQSLLLVSSTCNSFNAKVDGVVKGRVLAWLYQGQLTDDGLTIPGAVHQKLCTAV